MKITVRHKPTMSSGQPGNDDVVISGAFHIDEPGFKIDVFDQGPQAGTLEFTWPPGFTLPNGKSTTDFDRTLIPEWDAIIIEKEAHDR